MTIFFAMVSGISLTIGVVHLIIWGGKRTRRVYLLSAGMAIAAGAQALLELGFLKSASPDTMLVMVRWGNLAVGATLLFMIWFVRGFLSAGRNWLALVITALWGVGLVVNFALPGSLTFSEIQTIQTFETPWGEPYGLARGVTNSFKYLADIASVLIMVFVIDASISAWRNGLRRRAAVVGGSITFFIVVAGIHTPLVDAGAINSPTIISVTFLAIIAAMSYEIARDVTRSRMLARDLERTHRQLDRLMRSNLLGEFASSLAHELSQPLSTLLANAQLTRRYLEHDPPRLNEAKEAVEGIIQEDKRAGELIHRLHSMLQKGEIQREAVDLEALLDETLRMLDRELRNQKTRLDRRRDVRPRTVMAGRVEIQQVVLNLILNATQALELVPAKERTIRVRVVGNQREAGIEISDSGPGIPPAEIERLFEPFNGDRRDNLGLGLSICRRILEAHGGSISAKENTPRGAVFTFTLPLRAMEGHGDDRSA